MIYSGVIDSSYIDSAYLLARGLLKSAEVSAA